MKPQIVSISVIEPPMGKRLLRVGEVVPAEIPLAYFLESEQGEIWLTPNSAEWFDWLNGLASFEFDGVGGDFTACKETPNNSEEAVRWIAFQKWGDNEYQRDLGATNQLTTSYLEAVAIDLEDEVAAHETGGTGASDLHMPYAFTWKKTQSKWSRKTIRQRTYQCRLG